MSETSGGRALLSLLMAVILIATGIASAWVLATSGVFSAQDATLQGPLASAAVADTPAIEAGDGARVLFNAQLSQPRDPFRPLISEDSPTVGLPGAGGTPGQPGDGNGDGNGDGDGNGFEPGTTTIMLVDIRDVDGTYRATIVVNGVTYDVGVGDTFAGVYQVVSIDEDSVVIRFGDSVFTLTVGQEILK
jgi:type IV pilus biogenesis protein PilP